MFFTLAFQFHVSRQQDQRQGFVDLISRSVPGLHLTCVELPVCINYLTSPGQLYLKFVLCLVCDLSTDGQTDIIADGKADRNADTGQQA